MNQTMAMNPNLAGRNDPKPVSEMDVFRLYQARLGFESDASFALALGIERGMLSNWYRGIHAPSNETLQGLAFRFAGKWQSEMVCKILSMRGETLPCVCLEIIGDNGACPKHGAVVADSA